MRDVDDPSSSREMAPGKEMEPADTDCNSPSSPSSLSSSSTSPWVANPSRIQDSAPRPRRSLLSSHFSASPQGEEPKVQQLPTPERPPSLSVDVLSKSLPSPPISAFLEQEEEEALEPSTPPHVGRSLVPPMAPRKSFRYRVAPKGKHKPRRLLFGEEEEEEEPPALAETSRGDSSSRPAINGNRGASTPPHQFFNSFAPSKRIIHMRNLR